MKLTENDLLLLRKVATAAAYDAGQFIAQYKGSSSQLSLTQKVSGDSLASQVVTEVDHISQDIILDALKPSCKRYDLGLLAEEGCGYGRHSVAYQSLASKAIASENKKCESNSNNMSHIASNLRAFSQESAMMPAQFQHAYDDHSRLTKDYFWCIDPLDGTLPFVESQSGYAVSISLVSRDGEPQIGIVYDPQSQVLFHAIKGRGLFRQVAFGISEKFKFHKPSSEQPLTFIIDRSFVQHPLFDAMLLSLKNIAENLGFYGINIIQHGGAVMNACWVLEHAPACYFKFPKASLGGGNLWDYAATACIAKEAGAFASDIHGAPLELNRKDSTFMNHKGVLFASNTQLAQCIINLYADLIAQSKQD